MSVRIKVPGFAAAVLLALGSNSLAQNSGGPETYRSPELSDAYAERLFEVLRDSRVAPEGRGGCTEPPCPDGRWICTDAPPCPGRLYNTDPITPEPGYAVYDITVVVDPFKPDISSAWDVGSPAIDTATRVPLTAPDISICVSTGLGRPQCFPEGGSEAYCPNDYFCKADGIQLRPGSRVSIRLIDHDLAFDDVIGTNTCPVRHYENIGRGREYCLVGSAMAVFDEVVPPSPAPHPDSVGLPSLVERFGLTPGNVGVDACAPFLTGQLRRTQFTSQLSAAAADNLSFAGVSISDLNAMSEAQVDVAALASAIVRYRSRNASGITDGVDQARGIIDAVSDALNPFQTGDEAGQLPDMAFLSGDIRHWSEQDWIRFNSMLANPQSQQALRTMANTRSITGTLCANRSGETCGLCRMLDAQIALPLR